MMDNIKLALDNSQQCWVSKFLRSLIMIGFISETRKKERKNRRAGERPGQIKAATRLKSASKQSRQA